MDQQVFEFYKSLSAAEKEAHKLAAIMLGSSYVVKKTHAFLRWQKLQVQTSSLK